MGAAATLSQGAITVDPGGEAGCQITVRNTGTVVDQFTFEIIGDNAGWTFIEPESVSLFPGAEQVVEVRFRPPRTPDVAAGTYPFAIKVMPQEDAEGTVVEEGTLSVAAFTDTTAELLPRTSRGRRSAVHELAVDNRGNLRINALLSAADADELLEFRVDPPGLVAEAGHASFAKVRIRPKKRFWRGPPQTRPFQVIVEPEGEGMPLAVDGTMLQEPMIPKWLPKALLLLLLLLLLLVGLWYALLRPTLEAAAKQAAAEELAEVKEEAAAAGEAAAAAEEKAAAAEEKAAAAEEAVVAVADEVEAGNLTAADLADGLRTARDFGEPFDFRLSRSVVPRAQGVASQSVPAGQTFALTDIVLQNPQADRGVVQIRRRTATGVVNVLLEVRLENFRDLDYHFVSPVLYQPGEEVQLLTSCDNHVEGGSNAACNASAYFSGFRQVLPVEAEAEPDA
jgi:hypothetical protein